MALQSMMRKLVAWLQGTADTTEPELVSLAAEVAAATSSARDVLARIPDGPARRSLLDECAALAQAAQEVVDPRSQLQDFSESRLDDAIQLFMQYQVQAAVLRAAAHRLARKREEFSWGLRSPARRRVR